MLMLIKKEMEVYHKHTHTPNWFIKSKGWWRLGGGGKINCCSPSLSQRRVKTLLNSSQADALPNQPASLSLIFYLASSSDMSSNAHRTHQDSTACQHINQAPLSPTCPVCREQSVNRIKLLLSPASREVSAELRNKALTADPTPGWVYVVEWICVSLSVCMGVKAKEYFFYKHLTIAV